MVYGLNIHILFKVNGFPYIRLDSTVHHFVKAADNYLSDNEGKVTMGILFFIADATLYDIYYSTKILYYWWIFIDTISAVDTALIFRTEAELDQTLYYLIGNSNLRVSKVRIVYILYVDALK